MKIFIFAFIGLIFSSCSLIYPISFNSNPQGANIICNGKSMGFTPFSFHIGFKYDENKKAYYILNKHFIKYVSGTMTSYNVNKKISIKTLRVLYILPQGMKNIQT